MMLTPRRLIVCADDYAISPAVSRGIRELAEAGRISATGVMACMPCWRFEAASLKPLAETIDVGLHLTLTDQRPLGAMPLLAPGGRMPSIGAMLKRSLLGGVPADEVAAEVERQLDSFETQFGRPPDFIDGHQHVHLLPVVRQTVLGLFGRRLDPARCWLRDCADRPLRLIRRGGAVKAGIIAGLGRGLRTEAKARGILTNSGFSGFYGGKDFAACLPAMLKGADDGHLLMVHPGHVDVALEAVDSLTTPRQAEWEALMGNAFQVLLAYKGFSLTALGKSCQTPPP